MGKPRKNRKSDGSLRPHIARKSRSKRNANGEVRGTQKSSRRRLVANKSRRLLEAQEHKCACCGVPLDEENTTRDHNPWHHKHSKSSTRGRCSACLRAMLCQDCNTLVGDLENVMMSSKAEEVMNYVLRYAREGEVS